MAFHHRCGQNIRLSHENTVALRIESYNKGVVYSKDPLEIGEPFLIRFDQKEGGWAGGLRLGLTLCDPDLSDVPAGVLDVYNQDDHWVLSGSTLHHNHVETNYTELHLESVNPGDTIGVMVTAEGELHFQLNGIDKGAAAYDIPVDAPLWIIADIYGQAKQITVQSESRDADMADEQSDETDEQENEPRKGISDIPIVQPVVFPAEHSIFPQGPYSGAAIAAHPNLFGIPVHMAEPPASVVGLGSSKAQLKAQKKAHDPKPTKDDPFLFEGVTG